MIGISEFFRRIKSAHMREILVRTTIRDSLKKIAGVDVGLDSISFSSDSLVLKNVSSAARSAVFIKKTALIQDINRSQTFKKITDIR